MDFIWFVLCLFLLAAALAVASNFLRERSADIPFELEPNCLLTRFPIFFVTGPRSFFYFKKYWNLYPSYLAEHGYEVYHLRLPWSHRTLRQERFEYFLQKQLKQNRSYHLFMDSSTLAEFEAILRRQVPEGLQSVTEIAGEGTGDVITGLKAFPVPFERVEIPCGPISKSYLKNSLLRMSYDLHRMLVRNLKTTDLSALGVGEPKVAIQNSQKLLARVQDLAEMDFRS